MSKKLDKNTAKNVMDAKTYIYQNAKRMGIIALVSLPIIMFINYILANEVPGFTTVVQVISTIVMFGLSSEEVNRFEIDEKQKEKMSKESNRDSFAD